MKGSYCCGKKHGEWVIPGVRGGKGSYSYGKKHGKWKEWNGYDDCKEKGVYRNNKKEGKWRKYNSKHFLISTKVYENGRATIITNFQESEPETGRNIIGNCYFTY